MNHLIIDHESYRRCAGNRVRSARGGVDGYRVVAGRRPDDLHGTAAAAAGTHPDGREAEHQNQAQQAYSARGAIARPEEYDSQHSGQQQGVEDSTAPAKWRTQFSRRRYGRDVYRN